jgi:hypothetical protein
MTPHAPTGRRDPCLQAFSGGGPQMSFLGVCEATPAYPSIQARYEGACRSLLGVCGGTRAWITGVLCTV